MEDMITALLAIGLFLAFAWMTGENRKLRDEGRRRCIEENHSYEECRKAFP